MQQIDQQQYIWTARDTILINIWLARKCLYLLHDGTDLPVRNFKISREVIFSYFLLGYARTTDSSHSEKAEIPGAECGQTRDEKSVILR